MASKGVGQRAAPGDLRRAAAIAGAGFALPALGWLGFRLAYYGDWLPNPARAKIGGLSTVEEVGRALSYLGNSWQVWLPGGLAGAIAAGLAMVTGRDRARAVLALLLSAPIWAALLAGGGDHMPWARLTTPAVVLTLLAGASAGVSLDAQGPRATVGRVTLLLGLLVQAGYLSTLPVARDFAASLGRPIGRFLEANLPAGALVCTASAGATAYYAPSIEFIDALGLNDRVIARRVVGTLLTRGQNMPGHQKGDGAYVLERAPNLVILGPTEGYLGADPAAWFLTDKELLDAPAFRATYTPYAFPVRATPEEAALPAVARLIARSPDPAGDAFVLTAWVREPVPPALAALGHALAQP